MSAETDQTITPQGSVRAALAAATARLRDAGLTSPRLDAELLLLHVLGWDRARLYAALSDLLPPGAARQFSALLDRRLAGEPVAYLIGQREFMGLGFTVGAGVLVPRPETECLVEWLIARVRATPAWQTGVRIADIGAGSGAIALALAQALPQARVVAVDRSPDALAFAAVNSRRHTLSPRIALVRGDLLGPCGPLDAIAANLPYLRPDQLHPGIAREPHEALLGGPDGLDLYRALLPQAAALLQRPGLLTAEIDPDQATTIQALCYAAFADAVITVEHDLAGLARFVTVERTAG